MVILCVSSYVLSRLNKGYSIHKLDIAYLKTQYSFIVSNDIQHSMLLNIINSYDIILSGRYKCMQQPIIVKKSFKEYMKDFIKKFI